MKRDGKVNLAGTSRRQIDNVFQRARRIPEGIGYLILNRQLAGRQKPGNRTVLEARGAEVIGD